MKSLRPLYYSLLALMIAHPFLVEPLSGRLVLAAFVAVTFVCCFSAFISRIQKGIGICLIGLVAAASIANYTYEYSSGNAPFVSPYALPLVTVFWLYAASLLMKVILRAREANIYHLFGAASVYLLIGFAGGSLFAFIAYIQPAAFSTATGRDLLFPDYLFFSFTTLTTVGYGDITPVTRIAQSLSMIEAITGILLLAVIIGRLIGNLNTIEPKPTNET